MLIEVKNLTKTYLSGEVETKVLHGLSFTIDQGEFIAIMGPSGSGKSTLMHILGLLDQPSGGHYFFDSKEVTTLGDTEMAELRNSKIGFVFQSFNLLARTTVLENVKLPLAYAIDKKHANEKAAAVLKSVGLGHRMSYYSNQISGGEKQRVAIARALVNSPSVIFADEPTGNLDSKSGIQVMEILQALNKQGNTIILVTHETYTAEHAKRVIKIKDGLIVSDSKISHQRIAHDGEVLK